MGPAGATAVHIPLVGGALVFLYNLPGVNQLRLAPATVAAIFQQRVERWDDPRIAADNPGVDLPPTTVWPVHRSDSSGSTSILGEYLSAAAAGEWTLGAGKTLAWPPGGLAAERSDGVTAAVDAEPGGITYAELSFAARQGLPTAALANPSVST
ncbi:substrate-binding domain-containing protein [Parafrankia sp. FMc6]|uniref:substrate-binding domain-containing protein n=1 Tax=Parafrankia soli TaxID=2599596 RepID=UPI0034D7B228